ncbi:MAG: nucleotide exchange factor GrpE [Oscillospiraceae bacterium]|nr:nucleotide exchange factor GrpE [Oscillospiraceae bacterium]
MANKKEHKDVAGEAAQAEEIKTTTPEDVPAQSPPAPPVSAEDYAQLEEQHRRILAEYANYKRRTEQEKTLLGEFIRADLLLQLLPALDNLERAVAAPDGKEYKAGVDMTITQLKEALQKLGLTEMDALNQPFDPEQHHAVQREDAVDVPHDTVTAVLQKGYTLGGKVLRPAMVKVAN